MPTLHCRRMATQSCSGSTQIESDAQSASLEVQQYGGRRFKLYRKSIFRSQSPDLGRSEDVLQPCDTLIPVRMGVNLVVPDWVQLGPAEQCPISQYVIVDDMACHLHFRFLATSSRYCILSFAKAKSLSSLLLYPLYSALSVCSSILKLSAHWRNLALPRPSPSVRWRRNSSLSLRNVVASSSERSS
jgi:hypothetical protein